ncbi:MAG: hypothetical protein WEC72_01880 [Chthoniobacterales bacterium]
MKTILTIVAVSLIAISQTFAHCGTCGVGRAHVDKDGCVKGETCKCKGCDKICGSEACKTSNACKGDGC